MNLQSNKLSHVHRIPVVVQSVPVVYTAVRSPGNVNNTIVVPLLEDGRSHGKGKGRERSLGVFHTRGNDCYSVSEPEIACKYYTRTSSVRHSMATEGRS